MTSPYAKMLSHYKCKSGENYGYGLDGNENAQGCTYPVWYISVSAVQSYTLLFVVD